MEEDYPKALEESDRIETLFGCAHEDRHLNFASYAEYRLGHLDQAKLRYQRMKAALPHPKYRDQALLEAFHALLFESLATFQQKCEEICQQLFLEDRLQGELARFLLKALLYEFEGQQQAKEAYTLRIRIAKLTPKSL